MGTQDLRARALLWAERIRSLGLPAYAGLCLLCCAMGGLIAWRMPALFGQPYRVDIFYHQFMVHEGPGALLTAAIVAMAFGLAAVVSTQRVESCVRYFGERPIPIAVLAFFVFAAGTIVVYQNYPLAMDEYANSFQAQVFAEGEVYGQFPPELVQRLIPPQFLNRTFLGASLASGKVLSTYQPGYALLLAPFMKLGVPWALNPLLSALTLLLIWHLARRLSDDPLVPGWAVLLTLASPIIAVNAISYYSSAAHLCLNLAFMALLLERTVPRLIVAGVLGSIALTLQQPVSHGLFALPWMVWLLRRWEWKSLGTLAAGYVPLAFGVGLGWLRVRSVIDAENAAAGLVPTVGPVPPAAAEQSTPILGEVLAFFSILQVPDLELLIVRLLACLKLFFWAMPGLPILALLGALALGRVDARVRMPFRLLGWSALVTFGFYFFVQFSQGHGWGYRYFHPAWAVLPLFGALALSRSEGRSGAWRRTLGLMALVSLVLGTAVRFEQVHRFIEGHRAQAATADGAVRQVRFVDVRNGYYTQDLVHNDPFLRGPVWTFVSFGREADAALVQQLFPGARLAVERGDSTAWVIE